MRANIIRFDRIKPKKIEWFWENRIPSGKFSVIAGDPGIGKSTLIADLVSHVTSGKAWPDGAESGKPGSVILLSDEDDVESTMLPRMIAAGADRERVHVLTGIRIDDQNEKHFSLKTDLEKLEVAIRELKNCRLIVIDPLSAYLDKVNTYSNSEVRGLLSPLCQMAERNGVTIIAIEHLNKRTSAKGINRLYGTLAFVAAARSVWLVGIDSDDKNRRLLLPMKCNQSKNPSGLSFTIETSEQMDWVSVVQWSKEPVFVTAEELLSGKGSGMPSAFDQAVEFLEERLAKKSMPVNDLQKEGESRGISIATLRRAQKKLGIQAKRKGFGKKGSYFWQFPNVPKDDQAENVIIHERMWMPRERTRELLRSRMEENRNDPVFDPRGDLCELDFVS